MGKVCDTKVLVVAGKDCLGTRTVKRGYALVGNDALGEDDIAVGKT
jgi:hypothetical protein